MQRRALVLAAAVIFLRAPAEAEYSVTASSPPMAESAASGSSEPLSVATGSVALTLPDSSVVVTSSQDASGAAVGFSSAPTMPGVELSTPLINLSTLVEPAPDAVTVSTMETVAQEPAINYETLIIQEVRLEGFRNVRETLVRSQVKTRKGDLFDSIQAKSDLRRLMLLGPFSSADVAVSTINISGAVYCSVKFILVEKPKIKKVHIKGAKLVSKSTIKDILAPARSPEETAAAPTTSPDYPTHKADELRVEMDEGAYFDETKLEEGLVKIREKYEEKAIFDTVIEVDRSLDEKLNKIEVTFKVKEGKKARIAALHLDGFESYPSKKIRRMLKIKPRKPYNSKKIEEGLEKLNKLYHEDGWLDFTVDATTQAATFEEVLHSTRPFKSNEIPITLVYKASEGKRHFLLSHRFEGNELIDTAELRRLASLEDGRVLKESALRFAEYSIIDSYREKGRLFANVVVEKVWHEEPAGVELVFKIVENRPVYISNIYIEGLQKTKDYVIKREILLKEGDLFNSKKLARSTDKIFNLGFIEDIRPDYDMTPNPDYVDLIFDIKEGRPGMLTAGAGFSSVDGVVGTISLQHLNLLGRAQRLNLSSEFGQRRQTYDATWTTPWTFDRRISTSFSIFDTNRSLQYASDTTAFKKHSKGGGISVSPRYDDDHWIFGYGYTLQRDEIYDVLEAYQADIPESLTTRSAFNTKVSYDTRDFSWDPKKGSETSLSLELAGGPLGGGVHFFKPSLNHSMHFSTVKIGQYVFVLSAALRGGLVKEYYSDKPVSVSDKFYVGGGETVRGYTYTGQIGPIDGGKVFGVANVEYKFPLLMEGRYTIIQFAVFADAGGSWRGTKEVNMNFGRESNNLKAGVGFGLRFRTPAFPVRLDWGWGLHHQPGESINQFYFTIGNFI
ncbi:MAG: outer membrane protein assembly factor BamA [Elusimicrobia bacterium]|nr:outer membrane protein assembly factor BamA [Elusimicrobiota bacterium]